MINEVHNKIEFYNHLIKRGLSPGMDIRCWIDWNEELIYFPMWSPHALIGYQRYSWSQPKIKNNAGRYFTWITEPYKPLCFWGLSRLSKTADMYHSQRVLVCEGIWDAIRCIQAGYNAVAVLTATPNKQFVQWFKMVMQGKETIGILDNDKSNAGLRLDKLCTSSIICELHKDIGEHSPKEAKQWLDYKLA